MALFGALYFISLPFILTAGGAEGARRSWAFTSLGLCLAMAVGLVAAADWARRRKWGVSRVAFVSVLAAAVAVIAIGNVASGISVQYRFPGSFSYGSDARTVSEETRGAVGWLETTAGPGNRTIADRDTGLAFGSLGTQWIEKAWKGFPLWEFYLHVKQPSPALLDGMRQGAPRYLIVDTRMSEQLPLTGVYFAPDEPGARTYTEPVPRRPSTNTQSCRGDPDLRVRPLPHLPAGSEATRRMLGRAAQGIWRPDCRGVS